MEDTQDINIPDSQLLFWFKLKTKVYDTGEKHTTYIRELCPLR